MSSSESEGAVVWQSIDPRNGQVVAYQPQDQIAIEQSFQGNPSGNHILRVGAISFTIDFSSMTQVNRTGGSRQVQRVDTGAAAARRRTLDPELPPEIAISCMKAVQDMDMLSVEAEKNIAQRKSLVTLRGIEYKSVLQVYDYIFEELSHPRCIGKFGGSPDSMQLLSNTSEGSVVPNYFANVQGETVYHRKVLSVLGLRNLVRAGCDIFNELKASLFSGDPSQYSGRAGLHKMRAMTGNTVDLDTVVVNCERQLATFNTLRTKEGQAPFRSSGEFSQSPMCVEYVRSTAEPLLDEFRATMKLTDAEAMKRALVIDKTQPIPTSTGNGDRGRYPIWLYSNVGVLTYHVNVPNLPDVFGALLKAPYHAARAFLIIYEKFYGTAQWAEAVLEYFDECISDSCFNGKWKSVELYLEKVDRIGSVEQVLDEMQKEFQTIFTRAFFEQDPQRTQERDEMVKLVQLHRKQGVDATSGKRRAITAADVDSWIKKTS